MVDPDDEALLDRLQRAAFAHFLQNANLRNGLVADTAARRRAVEHRGHRLRALSLPESASSAAGSRPCRRRNAHARNLCAS
jgi:hypothetical protein